MPHLQLLNKWRNLTALATPAQRALSAQGHATQFRIPRLTCFTQMECPCIMMAAIPGLTSHVRGTNNPFSPTTAPTADLLQGNVLSKGQRMAP